MNKLLALAAGFVMAAGISHIAGDSSLTRGLDESSVSSQAMDETSTTVRYASPVGDDPTVLRDFSIGEHNWLAGHRGVDLAGITEGDVLAAGDGRVIFAGKLNDRSLVSIEHLDGLRTTYEPLSPTVDKGDWVTRGQVIGTLEAGHCMLGPCLHWGAKRGSDDYINPMSLLAGPIRLVE